MSHRPYGPYERYVKRPLDAVLAAGALIALSPVFAAVAVLVRLKLGSPVLVVQERPGRDEKIFKLYKFRTMTDERDENGELLPDEVRLTEFGKFLRATSLDELPELFNILKGDMSVVGPRPLLVRDMVFMTAAERQRHTVRPGLTGLAQVSGRNAIAWKDKLTTDLEYVNKITFFADAKIVLKTVGKVFLQEGITEEGMATAADLGDYLLFENLVSQTEYAEKQNEAKELLAAYRGRE